MWCPVCVSPVPEHAARCGVCGGDLHAARMSDDEATGRAQLAPRLPESPAQSGRGAAAGTLARLGVVLVAVLLVVGALLALGITAGAAGLGYIVWPALVGIGIAALLAAAAQLLLRQRRFAALARGATPTATPTDLDLIYLFAARFAPAAVGRVAFWPPLAARPIDAAAAAWRAVGATLLDLAERDLVELEPRSLPTPGKPVDVVGVRLVRPLAVEDAFALGLLRPLARRGVGASTLLCDLVAQQCLMQRHPARALLASARDHLTQQGYYATGNTWLRAVLGRSAQPDAARILSARPALDALETRLAAWDERDPQLVAVIRHDALAGLRRARARAARA